MNITKLGHCCLLIEERGVRILTDPGIFTVEQHRDLRNIHAILYTHEHPDHYHLESLKHILGGNPNASIFCNSGVGKLLEREGLAHTVVGDGKAVDVRGVSIEGFGTQHAQLHSALPPVENTGYFLADHLWYPGDSFTNPGKQVKILALPVAGPWMKLAEAIDYALLLKPGMCFPVHDGIFNETFLSFASVYKATTAVLEPRGVRFLEIERDREYSL